MDKQQIFEKVCDGLHSQGWRRSERETQCMYRGPEGRRCAVGWLIPDDIYKTAMEGSLAHLIEYSQSGTDTAHLASVLTEHRAFLKRLQELHDQEHLPTMLRGNPRTMMESFKALALGHKLTWHERWETIPQ